VGALGERNFRLFFTGYVTSLVGSAMVPVALTFAVLDQGDGTAAVGYVLGAETVPLVALLLLGGVVADRVPRRASMLGADLARFSSEGLLAVLLLTGSPPLWIVLVLAGILGAGQAFFNPAMTGLMPEMVSPERLQAANALRGVAGSAGQVLGPGLAGIIVAAGGPGWAIAIDSATYAVSAACLLRLNIPARPPARPSSVLAQLAGGWHEFCSRTWLWAIVAQFATFNALCFAPFMVLGAVTARDRLGGAGAWGVILAALGAGSILGGLLSVRLRPRRPLVTATAGAALFALPLALIALPAATALIAIAAGAAGVGLSMFGTLWETTLQREVPSEVLSRVSAYDWFGSAAFVPIGFLIAAPIASLLGTRTALFSAAAWAAGSCAIVLTIPSVRKFSAPLPSPVPAQPRHEPTRADTLPWPGSG
jgi:MFS family permease